MKRRDLIKILEQMGCILVRNGGRHDWYTNPQTKQSQPVPRHNEVNENLAKSIIKPVRFADRQSTIALVIVAVCLRETALRTTQSCVAKPYATLSEKY